MYTSREMHKRRIALEDNPALLIQDKIEITEISGITGEIEDTSQHYTITISPDELEAYMEVHGADCWPRG